MPVAGRRSDCLPEGISSTHSTSMSRKCDSPLASPQLSPILPTHSARAAPPSDEPGHANARRPEENRSLMTELKAAVPFKVELTPWLINHLRAQHDEIAKTTEHVVSDLSYAGDEGGIVCHIPPSAAREMLVVSLTHVLVPRSMPLPPPSDSIRSTG
jgi:hypothetical protein